MSEELRDLRHRVERLVVRQRELDARLWTLENSRVFRLLQRVGTVAASVKARVRRAVTPGAEAAEKARVYREWMGRRPQATGDLAALEYQPRLEGADADYLVLLEAGSRLTSNAYYDLALALQGERFEVLYGDEHRRSMPLFKPGWSPELVRSPEYFGSLLVVSRTAFEAAGGAGQDLAERLAARRARFHRVPRMLSASDRPIAMPRAEARKVQGSPLVSIVICSRSAGLLKRCLAAIARTSAYPHREVVVVEHELDASFAGGCARVRYSGSFDFAAMNNLGAKSAKGEVILFLNDDVLPLDPGWLDAMVAQAQRPEAGVVGALLLYPHGSIQHAGIALGLMGYTGHPGRGTLDGGFWPWALATRNVSAVTGACLAIRRELFEKLRGFDSRFPVNFNDVDLCLRAREAGYEVILEAAARLSHDESRTRARGVTWEEREQFWERWGGKIAEGDRYYNPNLTTGREDCGLAPSDFGL